MDSGKMKTLLLSLCCHHTVGIAMYISYFKKNTCASSWHPILHHLPSGQKSLCSFDQCNSLSLLTAALKTFGYCQHVDAWLQERAIPSKKEQLLVPETGTCWSTTHWPNQPLCMTSLFQGWERTRFKMILPCQIFTVSMEVSAKIRCFKSCLCQH